MARKPTGNPNGRPYKPIDQKQFEKLCFLQCTTNEIMEWFDITERTLNSWCKRTYGEGFSGIYKQKKQGGLISLRRTQFQLAEKSPAMAIFLGKNLLGQSDRQEQVITTNSAPQKLIFDFGGGEKPEGET